MTICDGDMEQAKIIRTEWIVVEKDSNDGCVECGKEAWLMRKDIVRVGDACTFYCKKHLPEDVLGKE